MSAAKEELGCRGGLKRRRPHSRPPLSVHVVSVIQMIGPVPWMMHMVPPMCT